MTCRPVIRQIPIWVLLQAVCSVLLGYPAASGVTQQSSVPQELQIYKNARSVVDFTPEEAIAFYPELKDLTFADDLEKLGPILQRVGENVEAFVRDFPNTAAVERVRRERRRNTGFVEVSVDEKYNYLVLTRPGEGPVALREDRTDSAGKASAGRKVAGSSFLTLGYASTSLFFHPLIWSDSNFRLLGRQASPPGYYVIGFAQKADKIGPMTGLFKGEYETISILIQGVAWVDPASFQIVRMRTDLLAPRPDVTLNRHTTEIEFSEVRFEKISRSLWLPSEVVVTISYQSRLFCNRHRYSDYKLFTVETYEKREKPAMQP